MHVLEMPHMMKGMQHHSPSVSKALMVTWGENVRPTSQMRAFPVARLMVWKRTFSCGSQRGQKGRAFRIEVRNTT